MIIEPPLFDEVHLNLRYGVIEHKATHLHWDFRLEKNGTVKDFVFHRAPDPRLGFEQVITQLKDHPYYSLSAKTIKERGFLGDTTVKTWDEGRYDIVDWTDDLIIIEIRVDKLFGLFQLIRKNPTHKPNLWWFSKIDD